MELEAGFAGLLTRRRPPCFESREACPFEEKMMSTTRQTVLVTGGNSGFGRLIVVTLARQGAHVFAGMRDPGGKNAQAAAELRALAEQEHLALDMVSLDVT